ncbi:MAG: hypothetical protein ACOX8S_09795, partial [Christensenellales bacterium]
PAFSTLKDTKRLTQTYSLPSLKISKELLFPLLLHLCSVFNVLIAGSLCKSPKGANKSPRGSLRPERQLRYIITSEAAMSIPFFTFFTLFGFYSFYQNFTRVLSDIYIVDSHP